MKYLKQFSIIMTISLLGEILKYMIPLPVPASIYGLSLMLLSLACRVISVDSVKEVSVFLIDIMPLMFIPAAAGLLDSWGLLKPVIIPVAVITIVSTVIVMATSGMVTQYSIKWLNRKQDK